MLHRGRLTNTPNQRPDSEKEYIDSAFFGLHFLAHSIYAPNQAYIGLNEGVLGIGIQLLALSLNAIRSLLGVTDVVDAWLACEPGEFFESVFTNAIGATDEDGYKARGEDGWDASIGRLDGR